MHSLCVKVNALHGAGSPSCELICVDISLTKLIVPRQGDKDVEVFEAGAVRPYFMVNLEAQTATVHQCHRQIWMQSYEQIDNGRLSRVELNVLGSWMLGAMNSQRRHIKSAGRRKISKAHHVFPVC